MQIPLDFSFDTHFVYVDQCHENTLNIIVRAVVDTLFSDNQINTAATALVNKHPYLTFAVAENRTQDAKAPFILVNTGANRLSTTIRSVSDDIYFTIMQKPSPMREHRFDLFKGELAHAEYIHNNNSTIIEFTCAHLIGDVTAAIMLFSDLLHYLDHTTSAQEKTTYPQSRLIYDEVRYGWKERAEPAAILPAPDTMPSNDSLWPKPPTSYKRGHLPINIIIDIKNWLSDNNIEGKITDVFYYVIEHLYTKEYSQDLSFSAIFSFRHLFTKQEDISNVNSSAIFAHLEVSKDLLDSPKKWIESCYKVRNKAIRKEGIMETMHFLRCLNYSMRNKNIEDRRALINAYIPINSFFAINNFGLIDTHISEPTNFKIMDIDIQDGVPTQEVRIFGYGNTLHINPMLIPDSPISAQTLWDDFSATLTKLIKK
ncbi:hypothetical protein ACFL0R_02985 [Pseudomonadota bacterium]